MELSFYQTNISDLPITEVHRSRLRWFLENEGTIVPYSAFAAYSNPGLTTQAKGIYKPRGWDHSLSIKETLNSPYGDIPIRTLANGDWVYRYHREAGENKYTNAGLLKCMEDGIPVGVIIQVAPKPKVQYFVAGLGLILQYQDPWFDLVNWHGAHSAGVVDRFVAEPDYRYDEVQYQTNLPGFIEDEAVERYSPQLVRPNQEMFRVMLLSTYDRTCAVTESRVIQALEAAHIQPYRYEKIDRVQNGLLLRADVHRLFDRGLLGVDSSKMETVVSPKLIGSEYEQYQNQPLVLPANEDLLPSAQFLDDHLRTWRL